jgi:hypothetical protein
MMIINDDSRVVNKLETPLTDDARVVIYDRHMFIAPATGFGSVCTIVVGHTGTQSEAIPDSVGSNPRCSNFFFFFVMKPFFEKKKELPRI